MQFTTQSGHNVPVPRRAAQRVVRCNRPAVALRCQTLTERPPAPSLPIGYSSDVKFLAGLHRSPCTMACEACEKKNMREDDQLDITLDSPSPIQSQLAAWLWWLWLSSCARAFWTLASKNWLRRPISRRSSF